MKKNMMLVLLVIGLVSVAYAGGWHSDTAYDYDSKSSAKEKLKDDAETFCYLNESSVDNWKFDCEKTLSGGWTCTIDFKCK